MPDDAIADPWQLVAELRHELAACRAERDAARAAEAASDSEKARLLGELRESLERQQAIAELLGVINASPGDLARVFEAMLDKAMHLCGAAFGILRITHDGQRFHAAASRGVPAAYAEFLARNPQVPQPGSIGFRLLETRSPVHIADAMDRESYRSGEIHGRALVDLGGARTVLLVPLMKDRAVVGAIQIYRQEVRPFSDKQIALLQNFAAQAVIAMENARLLNQLRESLQQQTATAEILQVMNGSLADLRPVFEAIANNAVKLCNGLNSSVYRYDGELIHFISQSNFSEDAVLATHRLFPAAPSRDSGTTRAVADCAVVHIPDILQDPDYRSRDWAKAIGARSVLSVPMLRDGRPIGVITVNRAEATALSRNVKWSC